MCVLVAGRDDDWNDGCSRVASGSSALEDSDEVVAIRSKTSPSGCCVLKGRSSDGGDTEHLSGSVDDLEWAGGVRCGELNGDRRDGLRVRVVDCVLDGVARVETEVVGDRRTDGDNWVASAGAVLSVVTSGAGSAGWGSEVIRDATCEGSLP